MGKLSGHWPYGGTARPLFQLRQVHHHCSTQAQHSPRLGVASATATQSQSSPLSAYIERKTASNRYRRGVRTDVEARDFVAVDKRHAAVVEGQAQRQVGCHSQRHGCLKLLPEVHHQVLFVCYAAVGQRGCNTLCAVAHGSWGGAPARQCREARVFPGIGVERRAGPVHPRRRRRYERHCTRACKVGQTA